MPMPCSPEITPSRRARQLHDARDRLVRRLQHLVVVAVDRDVGVHVAVAGMHVQRHPDAAAQHLARGSRWHSSTIGASAAPAKIGCSGARICVFHEARRRVVLQQREDACAPGCLGLHGTVEARRASARHSAPHLAQQRQRLLHPVVEQLGATAISPASSLLPSGSVPGEEEGLEPRRPAPACCAGDSSMLMRSMPSVYSPIRGSGMTTSSLILKALVCLPIAAVRLRSSQNFLRASALTATKPSPARRVGEAHHLAGGARHARRRRRRRCRRSAPSSAGRRACVLVA